MKLHENMRQKHKEPVVIKYSVEFVTTVKVTSYAGLTCFDKANYICLHIFLLAVSMCLWHPVISLTNKARCALWSSCDILMKKWLHYRVKKKRMSIKDIALCHTTC